MAEPGQRSKKKGSLGWISRLAFLLLSVVVALPITILAIEWFEFIPYLAFEWELLIGFVFTTAVIYLFLIKIRYLVYFALLGILTVSIIQKYQGFMPIASEMAMAYDIWLGYLLSSPSNELVKVEAEQVVKLEDNLKAAMDFMTPEVREFAVLASTQFPFEGGDSLEYLNDQLVQHFALFRAIKPKWRYVRDPKGAEYFAKASESLRVMAGDCDDYTIFMAACIKATGGEAKMVLVKGHIFPVVLVADSKLEYEVKVKPLIAELFPESYQGQHLAAFSIGDGIWLNFDYTANYPGGPFMSTDIIKIIEL